jgi:uncharacterized protein
MSEIKNSPKINIGGETQEKYDRLRSLIRDMQKVLVAFSGGVDSTFLLKVAKDELGKNVLAVIARSETYPKREQREAVQIAEMLDARYKLIQTHELENSFFQANPPERCYFCKNELFKRLKEIASDEDIPFVCDGANFEDTKDYRPGFRAAEERGVRSPLKEAGLIKDEIRALSRMLGLPTWNKPAMACLSSRIPYYSAIEKKSLRQIDQAEESLRSLGFSRFRVRHHGHTARIEIDPESFSKIMKKRTREKVIANLKRIGYIYVTLDLAGYRTGSMNEPLFSRQPKSKTKEKSG